MAQLEPGIEMCQSTRILGLRRTLRTAPAGEWLDLGLQPGQEFLISNFYARSLARERIDEIFGDKILPGARIELDGGLWRRVDILTN